MRRKKKNEKLDTYRILMLPVMTMFLLNVGLIATTWAWYTASVSSGVNTITAGPQVDIRITMEGSTSAENPDVNGDYTLYKNQTYNLEITPGNAETGYLVLMDITDAQPYSTSLFDLFVTSAYAEEMPSKYYVVIPHQSEQQKVSVTVKTSDEDKALKLKKLWIEKTGETISNPEIGVYTPITDGMINLIPTSSTSYTINLLNENGTPLKQSEVLTGISTFSESNGEDQKAVVTVEDAEETQITMPVIDGYVLDSVNGEEPKESYPLAEGQDNVFNAKYKKVKGSIEQNTEGSTEKNDDEAPASKENPESNNVIIEGEETKVENPEQTYPADEPTEPKVGEESIEPPGNTEQEQPETATWEQQQNESSEPIDDNPVAQSNDTTTDDSTEMMEDDTDEIRQ